MSDISKNAWIIIISFYFLVTTDQAIVGNHSFEKNLVKNPLFENLTTLDYYFFTYNVIDHNTLLVKFDLTGAILFHKTPFVYDAFLYVSKLPATNYKIDIGPFSGVYEKELDGTITDHFTFCLVLMPSQQHRKFNNTLNRNNQTKTIFHKYLKSSYRKKQQQQQQQQQHILHYCTKMGPDEDRYHHKKKQGSEGDRVLLLLQLMMIGIFLLVIQIAHTNKYRKYKEAIRREVAKIRQEHRARKEHSNLPEETLERLRFAPIIDEEEEEEHEQAQEQEEEEEEEHEDDEDSVTLSHRRQPSPILRRKRSRSPSPSIEPSDARTTDSSIEHILESKPWLQIPK